MCSTLCNLFAESSFQKNMIYLSAEKFSDYIET